MPTRRLVRLPFDPELLGDPPDDLRYEVVDTLEPTEADGEVRVYVPPYGVGTGVGEVLDRLPSLEVVQTLTAGVDNVRSAVPDGVRLCSGRGIHDASTAELALTLVLSSLRGVPDFVRHQDRADWRFGWRPALADRTVVVVGYGAIGRAVHDRLRPFETTVVPVARTARDGVHGLAELPGLLATADVVILAVPLTTETTRLLDAAMLARLPDGALVVNVARGGVVDTDALVAELAAGRLHAALDVTDPEPLPADHPLWTAPNVLVTPHVGGASSAMWPRAHRLVRDQLHRYTAGEPLTNVVTGAY